MVALTLPSWARATTGPGTRRGNRIAVLVSVVLVPVIVFLDWLTPAGVVVGILLSVPIIATSAADSPRLTWLTFGAATLGFVIAAAFGHAPISPDEVWIPNRVFGLLTLPASCGLALYLQKRRREAERARDAALAASEINRLLVSLVAHDLRAPLAMAVQAIDYARATAGSDAGDDRGVLRDVQLRLRRNLGSIDGILRFFRSEADAERSEPGSVQRVAVARELEAEIEAFREEAETQGKPIRTTLGDPVRREHPVDLLVLRQTVSILLDNVLRHARPGPVDVTAWIDRGRLHVAVTDSGPVHPEASGTPRGTGVGLALCRALVARVGGSVELHAVEERRTRSHLILPLGDR